MGDRGRQLARRRDAVGMRELQLHLTVAPLVFASFCLYCTQCRNIGAGAAITAEFSVSVKHWLAASPHVHRRAVAAQPTIYEVTAWFGRIECCPDKAPLLRFRFKIEGMIPARRANSIGSA